MKNFFFILILTFAAFADEADVVFNQSTVHTYFITFESSNFWTELTNNAASKTPIKCDFEWNGITITGCGFRIKGNSSQSFVKGYKKPFKLEFDEFNSGDLLFGLEHLNFNNCFKDPTFTREIVAYNLFGTVSPAPRASFVRLFLNGEDWGLYVQVEEVEKKWLKLKFSDNDGNLFKGDPNGTLTKQPDFSIYTNSYELKTNTDLNDWSDLTNFIVVLNDTPPEILPAKMDELLNVYEFLRIFAINNFLVNLDSYWGTGHNYYFYDNPDYNKFSYIVWDVNEAFGNFQFEISTNMLLTLPHDFVKYPGPKPLADRLMHDPVYHQLYIAVYKELLEQFLTYSNLINEIHAIHNLARADVYSDTKKLYSDEDFETNLTEHIPNIDGITSLGLEYFPTVRREHLNMELATKGSSSRIRINEFLAKNNGCYTDSFGFVTDWIEIFNDSNVTENLDNYFLSDCSTNITRWQFPAGTNIPPYGYLIISAAGIKSNGLLITDFSLDASGERIFLSKIEGASTTVVDGVYFKKQSANVSYGRKTDGYFLWDFLYVPSPGSSNFVSETPETIPSNSFVAINEFMAKNDSVITDEFGEFDDWIEIYNYGTNTENLTGMFLTDNLSTPTKWQFPSTQLMTNSFLLLWADNDTNQGSFHLPFKLNAGGEEIGLYGSATTLVGAVTFGEQSADVSYGVFPNGTGTWEFLTPTPGELNIIPEPIGLSFFVFGLLIIKIFPRRN